MSVLSIPSLPPLPSACLDRGIALRPATSEDSAFMRELYVAGRWEEMATVGWPTQTVLHFLRDQYRLQTIHYDAHYADAARLVVECNGVAAGRLLLLDTGSQLRIVDIGLMPDYRAEGIGTLLIFWVQDVARGLGHGRVSLHVEPNNPAKRLYFRLGFQVTEPQGAYERMDWSATGPVS